MKTTSFYLALSLAFLLQSCSVMQNMMMKRMAKMPQDDKMEMMSKMMATDSISCDAMIGQMSCMDINGSKSIAEMAQSMMPLCVIGIMQQLPDSQQTIFLAQISSRLIELSYDSLSLGDKEMYKQSVIEVIESLD